MQPTPFYASLKNTMPILSSRTQSGRRDSVKQRDIAGYGRNQHSGSCDQAFQGSNEHYGSLAKQPIQRSSGLKNQLTGPTPKKLKSPALPGT